MKFNSIQLYFEDDTFGEPPDDVDLMWGTDIGELNKEKVSASSFDVINLVLTLYQAVSILNFHPFWACDKNKWLNIVLSISHTLKISIDNLTKFNIETI